MATTMFEDDNGGTSSFRVVWTIVVLLIFGVWAYISIKTEKMVQFSVGDASMIAMIIGGKIGQKIVEAHEAIKINNKS